MDLRRLRYFVAVAEELHFRRAAERLGISQPPLSQQIQDLEIELGVKLFTRLRKKVALTEEGALLLRRARPLLDNADAIKQEMQAHASGIRGHVRIAYMSAAMLNSLTPYLDRLRREAPGVEPLLVQMAPDDQVDAVARGTVDFGFVDLVGRALPLSLHEREVVIRRIWSEPLMLAASTGHPFARRRRIRLPDIAGEDFVVLPRSRYSGFFDQVITSCNAAGFDPRIVHVANQFPELVALVAAGYGISLVPGRTAQLWQGQIALVALSPTHQTDVSVVTGRQARSRAVELFRSVLQL